VVKKIILFIAITLAAINVMANDSLIRYSHFHRLSVIWTNNFYTNIDWPSQYGSTESEKNWGIGYGQRINRNLITKGKLQNRIHLFGVLTLFYKNSDNVFLEKKQGNSYYTAYKMNLKEIAIQPQIGIKYNFRHVRPAFSIMQQSNLYNKITGETAIPQVLGFITQNNKLAKRNALDMAINFELYFPIKNYFWIVLNITGPLLKKDVFGRTPSYVLIGYAGLGIDFNLKALKEKKKKYEENKFNI